MPYDEAFWLYITIWQSQQILFHHDSWYTFMIHEGIARKSVENNLSAQEMGFNVVLVPKSGIRKTIELQVKV